jgi:hypothetical protein
MISAFIIGVEKERIVASLKRKFLKLKIWEVTKEDA